MARSFSSAKALSSLITAKLSTRGFAAAASSGGLSSSVRAGAPSVMLNKKEESKISWVPDPVTGYYRPENHVDAAAEVREMLVNKKN